MGVKVSSATRRALVSPPFILFPPLSTVCLSFLWLYPDPPPTPLPTHPSLSLPLMSLSASCHAFPHFVILSPPLFTLSSSFLLPLCPSTSAPLPSLSPSLEGTHTHTHNTAATCCFGNILQQAGRQAGILHCSPLTQQPFLL